MQKTEFDRKIPNLIQKKYRTRQNATKRYKTRQEKNTKSVKKRQKASKIVKKRQIFFLKNLAEKRKE